MTNFNYQVGGSLPADAPSYVERQCDREYYNLLKESKYCYVFNCRQMGKSSLRVRVTHKLQAEGIVCATIDPQKIGVEVTCEQWYASAIRSLVGDLNLKGKFDLRSWIKEREMLSPVQRFAEFIEVVLREVDTQIVIFVEEIDRLLSLKFGMDDFFGLVRSLFEDRPTKPEYNRLTFSFLGVATPTDLIQSHNTSAFNIGYAVEMSGFTFEEALPLMQGLARKVTNPRDYLAAAVCWTGGQPFLIQRLLGIIEKELDRVTLPENIADWVEGLVHDRIVTNWESQDAPPHLTTIRDRVISVEEKLRGRMLGCYQQVLADGELEDDRSEERSKLRLTGLVVRREGKLRSYNPIYAAVFNNLWVERLLADLRPEFYGSAFRAWREAEEGQNQGFLLRGQALEDAEVWARGKRLSDIDEQFLRESREMERIEGEIKFTAERDARETAEEKAIILGDAKVKADRQIKVGAAFLAISLIGAGVAAVWATKSVNDAAQVEKKAALVQKEAKDQVESSSLFADEAQRKADEAKNEAKKANTDKEKADADRGKANADKEKADADRKKANADKEKADLNVVEEQKNLESAKSELENLSQESAAQVAAAQAKIADAEVNLKKAKLESKRLDSINLLNSKNPENGDLIKAILQSIEALIDSRSIHSELSSSMENLVKVLNESREINSIPEQNKRPILFSAPIHDDKIIVVLGMPRVIQVWDSKGHLILPVPPFLIIERLASTRSKQIISTFKRNNKTILISGYLDKTIKLQDVETGEKLELQADASIQDIATSRDGNTIVMAQGDGKVRVWSNIWEKREKAKQLPWDKGEILNNNPVINPVINLVAIDSKGETIIGSNSAISPNSKDSYHIWKLGKDKIYKYKEYFPLVGSFQISALAISPNGQTIVVGSEQGKIYLHNSLSIENSDSIVNDDFHRKQIRSIVFLSDSKFVTSSDDHTMGLWDIQKDAIIPIRLSGHSDNINSITFNPAMETLYSSSKDGTIKLWDIKKMNSFSDSKALLTFACQRLKEHPILKESNSICRKLLNE